MITCVRKALRPTVCCTRAMSLLQNTKEEKREWKAMKILKDGVDEMKSVEDVRWMSPAEQEMKYKLANATKLLPQALCKSVTDSMLRTDYTSLLNVPDLASTYWALTFLHVHAISVRLEQCSLSKSKMNRIEKKFVGLIVEDMLRRLKHNRLNLKNRKRFQNTNREQVISMNLSLQEALLVKDERVLTNAIWFTVLQLSCPLHEALLVTDWYMESLVKLESYSEDEFVATFVLDKFVWPKLGDIVAQPPAPELTFNYKDADRNVELGLTIDGKMELDDGTFIQADEYHYNDGPLDPYTKKG